MSEKSWIQTRQQKWVFIAPDHLFVCRKSKTVSCGCKLRRRLWMDIPVGKSKIRARRSHLRLYLGFGEAQFLFPNRLVLLSVMDFVGNAVASDGHTGPAQFTDLIPIHHLEQREAFQQVLRFAWEVLLPEPGEPIVLFGIPSPGDPSRHRTKNNF